MLLTTKHTTVADDGQCRGSVRDERSHHAGCTRARNTDAQIREILDDFRTTDAYGPSRFNTTRTNFERTIRQPLGDSDG